MPEERSDERGVGVGMGGGCPPSHVIFFLEDILETAQFGGTLRPVRGNIKNPNLGYRK